jgi:hypothetical protein
VSHTAPENDRCKSSLYIYLTTKCIQHWAPFRLSIWAENRTRADLTSFSTSDSKRYEARTQRWHDTDLKARYWSLTLSGCWKWTKIQESAFSLTTAYTSIVGVSDMHMNRNRKSFTIVSGCRKVKPKNSSTHIKNINMIALKQINKKKQWVVITQTKMFPIWSDINLCFGLLFSIMISLASGFAIFAFEIRIRMTGWFLYQLQLVAMSSRLAYRN